MKVNFKGKEQFVEIAEIEEVLPEGQIFPEANKYTVIEIPIDTNTKKYKKFLEVWKKAGGNGNASANFNLILDINTDDYWDKEYKIDERTGEAVHRQWRNKNLKKGNNEG
jgi:hypothetical protein